MNIPLFFGIVSFLGAIYIWIGKRASKDLETTEDYFLMGRKLSFFPLFLTLLATQLGGGNLLGAAQESYQKGWLVLFYPLGTTLGFFGLALGFGGKLRALNITTVAEIFETILQSRTQRYIASGLSIVAMFFILVAQAIAAKLFFVAMGVEQPLIFVVFWSVLVAYTVMGGFKAVVNTDILQALFIIATLIFAFFSVDTSNAPSSSAVLFPENMGLSNVPWCTWLFMPLLFMFIEQDMGQRCFAARSSKVISFSAIASGISLLACSAIAIYFGVLAKELRLEITDGTSVLVETIRVLTNPIVTTLFMVAVFLAIISTADSLLCSISSNISCDFLVSINTSGDRRINISRFITLVTGLLAMSFAYIFENVVTVLMISYELSVSILFIPIVAATLSKKPSRGGAYLSMGCGLAGFILFRLFEVPLPREMLTIALAFGGYFIGKKVIADNSLAQESKEAAA